jgi:hypothetical protein
VAAALKQAEDDNNLIYLESIPLEVRENGARLSLVQP